MFKPTTLSELFSLLNEMTSVNHGENALSPSKKLQIAERSLIIAYLGSLLILIAIALYARFISNTPWVQKTAIGLYILTIGLSITYLITITASISQILWKQRKKPFSAIMHRMEQHLLGDAKFLSRLSRFDKATLEYGLLQYRQSWGISESRVSLLAGNMRKLGLFPALAAASISASTLLKEGSDLPLWLPIILAAAFSIIATFALGQRERPQQVIELLEYTIRLTEEKTSHSDEVVAVKENQHQAPSSI